MFGLRGDGRPGFLVECPSGGRRDRLAIVHVGVRVDFGIAVQFGDDRRLLHPRARRGRDPGLGLWGLLLCGGLFGLALFDRVQFNDRIGRDFRQASSPG